MVYHKVTLGPTDGQMDDLSKGTEIKLSNEHFHGSVPFALTIAQAKKIFKAADAGRGCTLKLSAAQIKHHAMNGEGRFGDIARSAFNFLKPSLRVGLKTGMDFGKDYVEKKIAKAAGLEGEGFLGDAAGWVGHRLVDGAVDMLGGKVKPKVRKQRGGSFLGDAGRFIGHRAVDLGVGMLGGTAMPNQFENHNEGLRAALFQKKVKQGAGLFM